MDHPNENKRLMGQLDLIMKQLGSIRSSIASGVPRESVVELRDDIQSLTSAVQILSRTLERRSAKSATA